MTTRLPGFLGLCLFGGLLIGGEIRHFEKAATADIAARLEGPAKHVWVRTIPEGLFGFLDGHVRRATIRATDFTTNNLPLFTEPSRPHDGKIGDLRIELDRFQLAGLRIEHLEAAIPDCRFDFGLAKKKRKIRLSRSGVGPGLVRIGEADLGAFILKKFHDIKEANVRLAGGRVTVEGLGDFLLVQTRFEVTADLEVLGKRQLVITHPKVSLGGVPASDQAAATLVKVLNPVVDLDRDLHLHGAIDLASVEVGDGFLLAHGQTRIPDVPKFVTP